MKLEVPHDRSNEMTIEELKTAIKGLPVVERRKVALYILELEKDHMRDTVGPQVTEDLVAVSKVVQGAIEKLKSLVKDGR